MKILMDNLTRKVSELRKRVEESRRRLCAKKDEMNQLDQAVEKKENEGDCIPPWQAWVAEG